ncbi:MAG TPA: L,D-transpeptidase family protein [Candidatus Binataceae bacterium]|nr:L,D-transpeptidase family protein [Candidatus Binataceae bacterium]
MRIGYESKKLGKIKSLCGVAAAVITIVGAVGRAESVWAQGPTPVPQAIVMPSGGGPPSALSAELKTLVASGKLADLIYPDFSNDQGEIASFYLDGGYAPVWFVGGKLTPQATELIQRFESAQMKGLNPDDYDGPRWTARVQAIQAAYPSGGQTPSAQATDLAARFDLAMTVAAMRYFGDLHSGRVNPDHLQFSFNRGGESLDLSQFLRERVIDAEDMNSVIAQAEPPFQGYQRAEAALADYLALAKQGDGQPLALLAKSVRPGDDYPALPQLAVRLNQLGDWPSGNPLPGAGGKYSGPAVAAVEHFQRRMGLAPDGVIGKGTIAALNVPLSHRVMELELALERYRWIPPQFDQAPVIVNIPEFRLRTMRTQPGWYLSMNVVVGRAYRHQTPVFTGDMKYVIFRPYWNVPLSIQFNELIPKIRRDPNYLAANNYEVVDSSQNVVTDGTVSDAVLAQLRNGSLFIRQKPGPKNALGLVKFIFPNSYNVYLHSTPAPELFSKARRDFSHGCIRVEDPTALAAWVLRDKPGWDLAKIQATMNGTQTVQVNLDHPIPVLIIYTTAVVEPDGQVHFFDDIYGYDKKLEQVLAGGYPYKTGLELNKGVGTAGD